MLNGTNFVDSGADDQSFINPFSVACRKDSDHHTEGELTAEGFYILPDKSQGITSARAEVEPAMLKQDSGKSAHSRSASMNGTPAISGQMSPCDVMLQEQQKHQITRKIVTPKMTQDEMLKD